MLLSSAVAHVQESPAQARCVQCERALIYARESKFDAKAGNRSPEEQVGASLDWCKRTPCGQCGHLGIEPVVVDGEMAIIDSGRGASIYSRNKGQRDNWDYARQLLLKGDAKGPIHYLVTWAATRATRDLADYVHLRDLCVGTGVKWVYGGKVNDLSDDDDRFRTGLDVLLGERDVGEIRRGVNRAVAANVKAGKPNGRKLFGYRRIYDEATGAFLREEPDPEQARIVRAIFRWYLGGTGCPTIARMLNEKGSRTNSGTLWRADKVRLVLRKPSYIGKRTHKGKIVGDAVWPGVVTERTFNRAQARMKELGARHNTGRRQTYKAHMMTAALRCGVCKGRVWTGAHKNGSRRYQCRDRYCTSRDADAVDGMFRKLVVAKLKDASTVDRLRDGAEPAPELDEARAHAAELRLRLAEAVQAYNAGEIKITTMAMVEAELEAAIAEAEKVARRIAVPLEVDVPAPDRVEHWWDNELTPERRREIVAALFVRVELLPIGKGYRFRPETVDFEWREW